MQKYQLSNQDILYEDEQILVVRKHAGMAVQHAGAGVMDLEHLLLNYLRKKDPHGRQMPYLAVIHRLDQPVEGILVFARTKEAAAALNRQMQQDRIQKEYLAVATGKTAHDSGIVVHNLLKNGRENRSQVVPEGTPNAKRAELQYRVLEYRENEGRSLIRIRLKSGRHHQIRVQMQAIRLPLFGDRKYNPSAGEGEHLALCADHLVFAHPKTHRKMEFWIVPENPAFTVFSYFADKI